MEIFLCVCVHVRGGVIYLGRQVGCCEELIMVQQSGVRRPCFSLIMEFHSLVHRLQMERRCIRGGMGFHTQTHSTGHTHTLSTQRIRTNLMCQTNTQKCAAHCMLSQSYVHVHIGPRNYIQSILRGKAASIAHCLRSAAKFSPCSSLISASHNCPLIRSNRFFFLLRDKLRAFPSEKNISLAGTEMVS